MLHAVLGRRGGLFPAMNFHIGSAGASLQVHKPFYLHNLWLCQRADTDENCARGLGSSRGSLFFINACSEAAYKKIAHASEFRLHVEMSVVVFNVSLKPQLNKKVKL
jgi:hypothetical protein